jgi:hypothetical protein
METDTATDLLLPTTVREIRLDLTTRCNLGMDLPIGLQNIADDHDGAVRACLPRVVDEARFPLTLTWLAAIS